jgi:integrase
MAGGKQKLTARAAATRKPGRYGDGAGLYLVVAPSGARKWVFRFTYAGRVTETGLGSAEAVTLAQARAKAFEARQLVLAGKNPIEARRRASASVPTFGAVADAFIASKSSEWRSARHREQWAEALTVMAAPLRGRPVNVIDTEAVLAVLKPLWQTMPETASRLRGRIEAVLDAAKAKGYRSGENPAAWRGHLSHWLPKRGKLARSHYAAMDYREVPAFVTRLREYDVISAIALEFTILTAARSGEVYGARWSELDLDAKVWTVPASRMKSGREHRVPLSERAVAILAKLGVARHSEYVFPSPQGRKPLSRGVMARTMERLKVEGATVHGFRSAFRDWCGEVTSFQREVAEAALAHVVGDAAEQAYRRGDALEKRRAMMEAWSQWCESAPARNVIRFGKADGAA